MIKLRQDWVGDKYQQGRIGDNSYENLHFGRVWDLGSCSGEVCQENLHFGRVWDLGSFSREVCQENLHFDWVWDLGSFSREVCQENLHFGWVWLISSIFDRITTEFSFGQFSGLNSIFWGFGPILDNFHSLVLFILA